jgi:mono/diheme cytochrome c family protein
MRYLLAVAMGVLCLFALRESRAQVPTATGKVTFNGQIASIIYKNCSSCHRSGEAAPFSLLSYRDAATHGQIIAAATSARIMPPWRAEPASYAYRDERSLRDSDIALLRAWVDQGMPEGTGKPPDPPQFAAGWLLGEPDLVVEMPAAYHLKADGPDVYRNIALKLGLTEDKWITAIEMRPTARAAVHHVLYFADPNGRVHLKENDGSEPGFSGMRAGGATLPLGGWGVGAQPQFFPEGLALRLPQGSDLVLQYHFHPTGKPEVEKSAIGLHFAKEAPGRTLVSIQLPPVYSLFSGLDIPAGEKDFVIRDTYTLPVDIDAAGVSAHAHYLARKMKLTATLPDGEVKTLLAINDWNFNWQDQYFFRDLVALPRGTRLDADIHWDNSAENPNNPTSPPVRVAWGEQSKDEMGALTLIAVPHRQLDYRTLQRDVMQRRATLAQQRIFADPSLLAKISELLAQ